MSKVIISRSGAGLSARVTASDGDGNSAYCDDNALNLEEKHAEAVRRLCARMNWSGKLVGGYVLQAGKTVARAWVWDDHRALRLEVTGKTIPAGVRAADGSLDRAFLQRGRG